MDTKSFFIIYYFVNKGPSSQACGFSSGHVWMWELDYEEGWAPKNWCFWTVVLEKSLEGPLDCKEIQPVHSEGDQPWDFFGRNDAKAEAPVLWSPHAKSWLIRKDFDAGRDWGQEKKGTTEDEMAGWHHRLDGHESEWTPGDGEWQGGLACCSPWDRKESDTTERLNNNKVVLVAKNPPANAGNIRDAGSIPGSGRPSGGGHGNPLQYSCLENPTDRKAWQATVHRVAKSQTQLKWISMHAHMQRKWT